MNEKKRKPAKQPKLTKAQVKKLDVEHLPQVEEAWESYHNSVITLIEQGASDDELEDQRNFATYYYEAFLDLIIGTRKKR